MSNITLTNLRTKQVFPVDDIPYKPTERQLIIWIDEARKAEMLGNQIEIFRLQGTNRFGEVDEFVEINGWQPDCLRNEKFRLYIKILDNLEILMRLKGH